MHSTSHPYQLLPRCHEGNSPIFQIENGGTVYAGGWNRNAWPEREWATIDLTGSMRPPLRPEARRGHAVWHNTLQSTEDLVYGPWLSLPIEDFGVPEWDISIWKGLKLDVSWILRSGTDLLIACDGGHGRTGLAVSILAYLFAEDDLELALSLAAFDGCPITWLRYRYCDNTVETQRQVRYVYDLLELGEPPEEVMPFLSLAAGAWYYNQQGVLTHLKDVPNED